jgi:hypothetical protein
MGNFENGQLNNRLIGPSNTDLWPDQKPHNVSGDFALKAKNIFKAINQKIFIPGEYRKLKLKESRGELSEEEFERILEIDFDNELLDNPSIKGEFSPEIELEKIKSLSASDKFESLEGYKGKLSAQREALASCRIFVERSIEYNNNTPKEKLINIVHKFSDNYGFTNNQRELASKIIDEYYIYRQRAQDIRQKYPNNIDLVNELTGLKFDRSEIFNISVGPMSVDIVTNSKNANKIYNNSLDTVNIITNEGFSLFTNHENPIMCTVINNSYLNIDQESTLIHEHEHQKNHIFRKFFDNENQDKYLDDLYSLYENSQDKLLQRSALEEYFKYVRQIAFQDAKEEVLAMMKDGDEYEYDFFFKKDNSSYDYLSHVRDWDKKGDDSLWSELAEKILVDEYRNIFMDSVSSFSKLEESGYSKDQIIAMFTDKQFQTWSKTAKRLIEQKDKR